MLHVVLHEPEIPHNTGNIVRLCANAGVVLHLVEPLGFALDDQRLRRARLDYADLADVQRHRDFAACRAALATARFFAIETGGKRSLHEVAVQPGDAFVFGSETRGLPAAVLAELAQDRILTLPMRPGSRSLNLSNAVAITVYEAWRQLGFRGAAGPGEDAGPGGYAYCATS